MKIEALPLLPPPDVSAESGRGRGKGGRGRGGRRGRPCKTPVVENAEPPSEPPVMDSTTILGAQPKTKVAKKLKTPNNGDVGPDFFEGKVAIQQDIVPQGHVGGPPGQSDLFGEDETKSHPIMPDAGKVLGCPRCYFSKNGCSVCRRPGYTPRGPRGPKKAAAKAKSKAVKQAQLKGRGRGAQVACPKSKAKLSKPAGRGRGRGRTRAQKA